MLITLTTRVHGALEAYDRLCEAHARPQAERLELRWPEPHEHSTSVTRPHGVVYELRVFPRQPDACDYCEAVQMETLAEA